MARKKSPSAHTAAGHTRDVKVERIGKVTIYQRGDTYYLYYRQAASPTAARGWQPRRRTGDRAQVLTALDEGRPSPIAYQRTARQDGRELLRFGGLRPKLALRLRNRYRAALDRFRDFCAALGSARSIVSKRPRRDFVKWLRGQKRTRNGAAKASRCLPSRRRQFILSTCRTAFNWALRHRMLPPYSENPFSASQSKS